MRHHGLRALRDATTCCTLTMYSYNLAADILSSAHEYIEFPPPRNPRGRGKQYFPGKSDSCQLPSWSSDLLPHFLPRLVPGAIVPRNAAVVAHCVSYGSESRQRRACAPV